MPRNIIVASSEGDQIEELANGARAIAAQMEPRAQTLVKIALSIEELQRKQNAETVLLIVAATLPQQISSSDAEHEPGLSFVKTLSSQEKRPACILVSARYEHYRAVQGIKRCELLVVDNATRYIEQCLQLARKLELIPDGSAKAAEVAPAGPKAKTKGASGAPGLERSADSSTPAAQRKFALVEVNLPTQAKSATVRLEIHTPGRVERREPRALDLKEIKLKQLMIDCKKLKDKLSETQRWDKYYARWHADYRNLGEGISNLLWSSRYFKEYYDYGCGAAEDNIRVRFNLQQPWFDGLWEAISAASGERRPLMLQNTIARRALDDDQVGIFTNDSGQIDTDGGVLNILVIKSAVTGQTAPSGPTDPRWNEFLRNHNEPLRELPHLDREVEALLKLRGSRGKKSTHKFRVKVDVLPRKTPLVGEEWSLKEMVTEWLKKKSRRYDIVHFAGHALFPSNPKDDDRGYLVFSGFPRPEAVPIAKVATWLANAGVQLVYLSCCRSSAASAALEFARNNIPMAIGFHWDLNDEKAPVFAEQFYDAVLSANLKVCSAVSKARLELYNEHKDGDPIWASPVLIAQPTNWIQVEGVLKLEAKARPAAVPPPVVPPGGEALSDVA
jgi:hypothetical protein